MREHIRSQLPSRAEAQRLWDQARRNALWQYNPHPSVTFFPNLLHHIYSSSSDKSPKPIRDIDPRRLALLLMILAVACVVDVPSTSDSPTGSSNQSASSNPMHAAHLEAEARASRYHDLGRASLCEIPIMEETNVDTVLALFYEVWFLAVWSDGKKAVGEAWGIMGLVAKLAQSVNRGGGKSKVIPEEVEKRRALFWELLYLDARLSLSLGRPPSLSIHHMDCPRPSYAPDDEFELCESPHYFQEWKHTSYQQFLVPVLDAISKPGLDYKSVLELDRRIRDFAVPLPLRNKEKCASRNIALQRASMGTAVEAGELFRPSINSRQLSTVKCQSTILILQLVLLQLHRSYFIRALSGPEEAFNRRHKYAPSVVAVFLSASRMIATIQELFQKEPELTSRILWYWSNAFSAAIALCLLVSRAPFTCLSPAALQDLQRARLLFRAGKEICPRASQVLPILETMVDKANDIYFRWSNGQELPTIVLRHITEDGTSYTAGDEHDNERRSPSVPPEDAFLYTHQSLSQCIAEVHQIARTMFPLRKPCNCSNRAAHQPNTNGTNSIGKQGVAVPPNSSRSSPSTTMMAQPDCPPSHEWSPPPIINGASPVLPEAPPVGYMGSGPAVGIGYPTYNRNGRMNGTSSYSSLSGSGMSPSPSPPVYGQQHMAGATFANGTPTYNGYNTNGASGGMYSPSTASSATVSYTKPNSPTYATPTALSPSTSQVPLQSHYSQQQQQQQQHLSSPVHSNNTGPGFYTSVAVLPASGPPVALPPPSSKLAMMDTINFELGALSANNEQSFMVFY
ncbi:hypothetical protein AGABI2DRAFT_223664 [Agaricus bisporus var. bisporus H97]|uniref:hypothetical protein n=1 Tax=Agaricus bisporus var. bisporus (strain H97 / ATCC MYA-4626 / FGSC 10389) TaxID=936046 RepID=UPI00029F549F|nr:hypothetical protein AGABI2DRAFT_223664 [Agaricus bisporus var. bisporus H97]EKV45574.1 hypothetical protein AGABI2DRAFT_223664 [Agaricus bisporus var. bisporus H97]